ncbi:unnamed protein product [Didymodactylos carnosus]|uniref:RXYLT1 C-terminal domain-containing protein n=1 Tax=Didymodactylos carnosus TaxID=1234261 RepID=A0A815H7U0_9BILA|nr:unnamed protein product [Didymodactylos carnosus]CAF4215848.1 unnamed protein product [Didymodactylos carnosus]
MQHETRKISIVSFPFFSHSIKIECISRKLLLISAAIAVYILCIKQSIEIEKVANYLNDGQVRVYVLNDTINDTTTHRSTNVSLSLLIRQNSSLWNVLLNDTRNKSLALFYRHATDHRNTSYPFISGDTFRAFADHIFDETTTVATWANTIENMTDGTIVFLKADMFQQFFSLFNTINCSFVLITHNSDYSAPTNYKSYLNDSRLLAWFAQNPDTQHSKLYPIPIGLANTRWPQGNLNTLTFAFYNQRRSFANRQILLYVNFKIDTNAGERTNVLNHAKTIQKAHIVQQKISFSTYLDDVGNSKFVLSPQGNGLDCHRTWEALLMGAIPIVHTSELDFLFRDLPVVIVKSWSEISENYLLSLNFTQFDNSITRILLAKYWYSRLISFTNRSSALDLFKT